MKQKLMTMTRLLSPTWWISESIGTYLKLVHPTPGPASPSMTSPLLHSQELKLPLYNNDRMFGIIFQKMLLSIEKFPVHHWKSRQHKSPEKCRNMYEEILFWSPTHVKIDFISYEYLHLVIIVRSIWCCYSCNLTHARCNRNPYIFVQVPQNGTRD